MQADSSVEITRLRPIEYNTGVKRVILQVSQLLYKMSVADKRTSIGRTTLIGESESIRRKACLLATLPTTNPKWTGLRLKTGSAKRPTSIRPS